MSEAT
jgi:hypothetical protein